MLAARAVAVNGSRHQLFASSALSPNQDGRWRGRDLSDQSGDFPHLQIAANDEFAFRTSFQLAQSQLVLILQRLSLGLVLDELRNKVSCLATDHFGSVGPQAVNVSSYIRVTGHIDNEVCHVRFEKLSVVGGDG